MLLQSASGLSIAAAINGSLPSQIPNILLSKEDRQPASTSHDDLNALRILPEVAETGVRKLAHTKAPAQQALLFARRHLQHNLFRAPRTVANPARKMLQDRNLKDVMYPPTLPPPLTSSSLNEYPSPSQTGSSQAPQISLPSAPQQPPSPPSKIIAGAVISTTGAASLIYSFAPPPPAKVSLTAYIASPAAVGGAVLIVALAFFVWRVRQQCMEEKKLPDHPYKRLLSSVTLSHDNSGEGILSREDRMDCVDERAQASPTTSPTTPTARKGKVIAEAVGQLVAKMRKNSMTRHLLRKDGSKRPNPGASMLPYFDNSMYDQHETVPLTDTSGSTTLRDGVALECALMKQDGSRLQIAGSNGELLKEESVIGGKTLAEKVLHALEATRKKAAGERLAAKTLLKGAEESSYDLGKQSAEIIGTDCQREDTEVLMSPPALDLPCSVDQGLSADIQKPLHGLSFCAQGFSLSQQGNISHETVEPSLLRDASSRDWNSEDSLSQRSISAERSSMAVDDCAEDSQGASFLAQFQEQGSDTPQVSLQTMQLPVSFNAHSSS
ncbi:hypothetical protein CEUSTIGMA_g9120.t1 [Chlamydomonas eustigma]|uniref:Uncharacterized protein n=1 Tax=Chlamydomonas eustigma TaxID=1157962 RepID=A0A250XFK6_9CHLO|nr:hypothetical protein CEUSTIGMA_g9120.t1 [Chlamydomonas eustigma]|eukprot:GAX81692.1 hypothetical protein CEUSTIGMA_g9120.t1 [Chlamydomonas eustigma]